MHLHKWQQLQRIRNKGKHSSIDDSKLVPDDDVSDEHTGNSLKKEKAGITSFTIQ